MTRQKEGVPTGVNSRAFRSTADEQHSFTLVPLIHTTPVVNSSHWKCGCPSVDSGLAQEERESKSKQNRRGSDMGKTVCQMFCHHPKTFYCAYKSSAQKGHPRVSYTKIYLKHFIILKIIKQ